MRIIFLDIDGVLNSKQVYDKAYDENIPLPDLTLGGRKPHPGHHLGREQVARLNQIIERTGAVVVLSSTWRILNSLAEVQAFLEHYGFKGQIVDKTPRLGGYRDADIRSWLSSNEWETRLDRKDRIESFVVIDDDSDADLKDGSFVLTSFMNDGLQDHHVEKAIQILETPF